MSDHNLESKRIFLTSSSDTADKIRSIPEILAPGEESQGISLKDLFLREKMDQYHVDGTVLKTIAMKAINIMGQLSEIGLTPGLMDLEDFYVSSLGGGLKVYLAHPERFQLGELPQDYEWYPEDERILGEIELFDQEAQQKADIRLAYRIMIGSRKGNVKIPPKSTEVDYSELFYKILSPGFRQLFLRILSEGEKPVEVFSSYGFEGNLYDNLEDMLRREILEEDEADRSMQFQQSSVVTEDKTEAAQGDPVTILYLILRTETGNCRQMSRLLYLAQDQVYQEADLSQSKVRQIFVYGDGSVCIARRGYTTRRYHMELSPRIREYSFGEAMMITADLIEDIRQTADQGDQLKIIILSDGKISNDTMFQIAYKRLRSVRGKSVKIDYIAETDSLSCQAGRQLEELSKDY
ncbi:MAG: hypothetical protein U0K57_06725 [Lachnospiraceae bacterium]|nr:hypothetical protein [Lachnospiraceae bacterium]